MKKCVSILFVVGLCIAFLLSGCSLGDLSSHNSPDTYGASVIDDGREVGGYVSGRIGDTLTNVFFSYRVNDAYLSDEFKGEYAEDGTSFLVVEITVKNMFDEPIVMFSDDFQVQWGEGDEDYGYPILKFHESQMEDEYTMKRAETVTALCVYEVPTPDAENEYSISYLEYYEDGVEGNVFFIYFDLEPNAKLV